MLTSRDLKLGQKVYFFDLMIEEATAIRFVKISEKSIDPSTSRPYRTHILVGFDLIHDIVGFLQQGKYQEFNNGEAYNRLKDSKVFDDKNYEFIIWNRNIHGEKSHIEICETGHSYANLIKNRDPLVDRGTFRILISKNGLTSFLTELDGLIFDASSIK